MNGYFSQAGVFLISVAFGFYILIMMLRVLLQAVRADFHNPVSQFVVRLTTPVLRPARRLIPAVGGLDLAGLLVLLVLQVVELVLIHGMTGQSLHPAVLLVIAVGSLLSTALWIFIVAIIVQVILSWVQPGTYNPVAGLLHQITAPVLRPFRNVVPVVSGMDLSPLAALVVLNLILMAIPYLQGSLLRSLLA